MNKNKLFLIFILVATFAFSCKRSQISKSTEIKPADEEAIANFIVQEIDFNYFSSKAKINVKDGKMDQNLNLAVRIKKDHIIWLSVTHPLGIEVARVMITPDTIYVHDKINSSNNAYGFDFINQKFNVSLNFQNLQAILVGNLPMARQEQDKLINDIATGFYQLQQENGSISVNNFVRKESMKLEKLDLKDNNSGNSLIVNYEEFGELNSFAFPYRYSIAGNIAVEGGYQNLFINIVHNKPEISDKELNFPFNMPN